MISILAHSTDATAVAVASVLQSWRGRGFVRWIPLESLSGAMKCTHRVDRSGAANIQLRSSRDELVGGEELGVVFNRTSSVAATGFNGRDHDYAVMEHFAFVLSWMSSLPGPVLNRPSPRGLAGAVHGRLEWPVLAARCGLPVRFVRYTTNARRYAKRGTHTDGEFQPCPRGARPAVLSAEAILERKRILIAGDEVVGSPEESWAPKLRSLASSVGCSFLSVTAGFLSSRRWVVETASSWPEAFSTEDVEAISKALLQAASSVHPAARGVA